MDASNEPLSFGLLAVSAPWIVGDRISISSAILDAIHPNLGSAIQSIDPIFFELRLAANPSVRISVGTRDFANPDPFTALVPSNLFAHIVHLSTANSRDAIPIVLVPVKLPKATSISLRPSADSIAYTGVPDIRPVLELHLRNHYATLTQSCSIHISAFVPSSLSMVDLRFDIEDLQPGPMASVINTDINLTILPVSNDSDELTLLTAQYRNRTSTSTPHITHLNTPLFCSILLGEYQYFTLRNVTSVVSDLPATSPVWLHVQCSLTNQVGDFDLYFHPYLRPTSSIHWIRSKFDQVNTLTKSFTISITHALQSHHWQDMFLAIHAVPICDQLGVPIPDANPDDSRIRVKLLWSVVVEDEVPAEWLSDDLESSEPLDSDLHGGKVQCHLCNSWVAPSSLMLHKLHCARNTRKCELCKANVPGSSVHDHCPQCSHVSSVRGLAWRHQQWVHPPTALLNCPTCDTHCETQADLAHHLAYSCPNRVEWCRYCRTHAPVDGEASFVNRVNYGLMTAHQVRCAARTVDCTKCGKPVQRRDVKVHMAAHLREKQLLPVPLHVCSNHQCGRVLPRTTATSMGKFGLCNPCYGPLYSNNAHGKELRLVIHRYFTQATDGCTFNKSAWNLSQCANSYCKNADSRLFKFHDMDRNEIAVQCIALAKKLVAPITGSLPEAWFCIPSSRRACLRRALAEDLARTHGWRIGWCLQALACTEEIAFPKSESNDSGDDESVEEEDHVVWMTQAYNWLVKEAPAPTKNIEMTVKNIY